MRERLIRLYINSTVIWRPIATVGRTAESFGKLLSPEKLVSGKPPLDKIRLVFINMYQSIHMDHAMFFCDVYRTMLVSLPLLLKLCRLLHAFDHKQQSTNENSFRINFWNIIIEITFEIMIEWSIFIYTSCMQIVADAIHMGRLIDYWYQYISVEFYLVTRSIRSLYTIL